MSEQASQGKAESQANGFTIIVNATKEVVPSATVTYDQVTALAYPTPPAPNTTYTVTFRNAESDRSGSLVEGGSVEVKKHGTTFDVDPTSKS